MNFIEKINVNCIELPDGAKSDQLFFYIDGELIGKREVFEGEQIFFDTNHAVAAYKDFIAIMAGQRVQISEFDTIENDLLFNHLVTADDIFAGSYSESYTSHAGYQFRLYLI